MDKEKIKFYKKWWFWIIIISSSVIVIGIFFGKTENTYENKFQNNFSNIIKEEKITFLKNTNGKEFYTSVCENSNIKIENGFNTKNSIMYESVDTNYSIEVETNKNNEINYIRLMIFKAENYKDFLLNISHLKYNGSNTETLSNWILDNLGKEANIKIGDANLKLTIGNNGKPILELYTDGNDEFQKQQLNNLTN